MSAAPPAEEPVEDAGPEPEPPPEPPKPPPAARPQEMHEKHAVRMVKDVFTGAEIVEEVHLQQSEGEHLHE